LETEWALLGGSLGTLPTSPRATASPLLLPWSFYHGAVSLSWWCEREAGYLEAGCALLGGSRGTLPTSPRAPGEREVNYLETESALCWGSLGTLPTSPRATARPLLLPWSFYHGAVILPWRFGREQGGRLSGAFRASADVPASLTGVSARLPVGSVAV
jgi:hypothetical protein